MYVSSSPLACRPLKRSVSGARGAATASAPLSISRPSSVLEGNAEASFNQLWMSASARKLSVASSPHSIPDPQSRGNAPCKASPQVVTVGFSIPQTAPQQQESVPAQGLQQQQQAQPPCRSGVSLLSKALAPQAVMAPPPSSTPASEYFPGVDTSLLEDLQERHTVFHEPMVVTAYMLAAHIYAGQQRKDGTSQLSHCVMTALQLAELGLGAETVAAGLLHEVLRINPLSRCHVEEFMPSEVVQLVDRVTTISEISHLYRHNKEVLGDENMRRMLLAMEDVNAVLIKLACRVHNMKTISALPVDKQRVFAQETLEVFSVVANRLGVWSLKAELEDLAFSVLHPEEYEALRAQVAKRQDPEALEATINRIKASLDERGVQYEDISGRPKNLYGIWCKMKAGNIASLDKVYDVTALRLVVTNKHDCYVALRCIQEVYRCMPGRSKDYIKDCKKPNGYQSLHETIYGEGGSPMEVQIRTHKMHYIAEYGFAAHWKYKEKLSNEDEWLDKEVQYKKWLTTYKLGLHDKKVRASGAPPRETALNSLGMHLIDGRAGAASSYDDPRVDPFLRHMRFRLQAPEKLKVSVVVQTQDSIDSRQLPLGYSAAQLAQDLHVDELPGYVLTINKRIPSPNAVLNDGDLVQVVNQSDTSPSSSPPLHRPLRQSLSVPAGGQSGQQQGRTVLYQPQGSLFLQSPTSPNGDHSSQRPPLPTRGSRTRTSGEQLLASAVKEHMLLQQLQQQHQQQSSTLSTLPSPVYT